MSSDDGPAFTFQFVLNFGLVDPFFKKKSSLL